MTQGQDESCLQICRKHVRAAFTSVLNPVVLIWLQTRDRVLKGVLSFFSRFWAWPDESASALTSRIRILEAGLKWREALSSLLCYALLQNYNGEPVQEMPPAVIEMKRDFDQHKRAQLKRYDLDKLRSGRKEKKRAAGPQASVKSESVASETAAKG